MSSRADIRHRRRRPRRRQGGRDAARGGLRRQAGPDRRRARAPVRAPAADQGLPARRVAAREGLRPPGGLLRRARHRADDRDRGHRARPGALGITLDDGERAAATTGCCSATGAEPRRIDVPGAASTASTTCARSPTATRCASASTRGGRVAVIGAGWIGAEFAASARQRGADVTLLDPMAVPLERVLGPEVGAVYRDLHREHGVQLLLGTGVAGASRATTPCAR